jgi:sugar-specific transcriptional regulator TrmB
MYMADFLDEKRNEIGSRLQELKPLVEEYQRLEAAALALDGLPAPTENGQAPARRIVRAAKAPSRRRGSDSASRASASTSTGTGRRGRPKGSGTRGAEALALVKATPGITIPEIAEKMGIKQNYLYRVLPGLAEDGLVTKDGRGWHPKEAA